VNPPLIKELSVVKTICEQSSKSSVFDFANTLENKFLARFISSTSKFVCSFIPTSCLVKCTFEKIHAKSFVTIHIAIILNWVYLKQLFQNNSLKKIESCILNPNSLTVRVTFFLKIIFFSKKSIFFSRLSRTRLSLILDPSFNDQKIIRTFVWRQKTIRKKGMEEGLLH